MGCRRTAGVQRQGSLTAYHVRHCRPRVGAWTIAVGCTGSRPANPGDHGEGRLRHPAGAAGLALLREGWKPARVKTRGAARRPDAASRQRSPAQQCRAQRHPPLGAAAASRGRALRATAAGRRPYCWISEVTCRIGAAFDGASVSSSRRTLSCMPVRTSPPASIDLVATVSASRADARASERGLRAPALQRLDVEVRYLAVDRHRTLDAQHELHVQRRHDAAVGRHLRGLEDHRHTNATTWGLVHHSRISDASQSTRSRLLP